MSQKKKELQKLLKDEAAKKELERQKRMKITMIVTAVVVVLIITAAVVIDALRADKTADENGIDYSIGLKDDGKIKGVDVSKIATVADIDSVSKNAEDYYPDKETEDTYINALLEMYPALDDKKGVTVKKGDRISIDYVGYVDGEEYEGGNTNNAGIDMTVGEEGYPGTFEEQIIGHKTGETFDVNIDFEEDFANPDLAGKSVRYAVTINGMLSASEFNDAFVEKYFSSYVSSADEFMEEYRKSLAETNYDKYLIDYIRNNTQVSKIPSGYLKNLEKIERQKDEKQLEALNESYMNLYQKTAYNDVYEMKDMDKTQYEEDIRNRAETAARKNIVIQAAFEKFNLSITNEDINEVLEFYSYTEEDYSVAAERFGEQYINQMAMEKALETYINDNYNLAGQE